LVTRSFGSFSKAKVVSGVKGQKMQTPTFTQTSVIAAAAALSLWGGSAYADQLAIDIPADESVFESSSLVPLGFRMENTGAPIPKIIELVSISQVVTPVDPTGDNRREVLQPFSLSSCFLADGTVTTTLSIRQRCGLVSTYVVRDADPFDLHQVVDSAAWKGGILVTYRFEGENDFFLAFSGGLITIKDDPIPEPSTWAMMLAGLAGVGAVLRHARRAPGRPHRSDVLPA
jgi:hypothetical protein